MKIRQVFREFGLAILLVFLIRNALVQAYHIPSNSMENTLLKGDYVLGDKLLFGTQIPDRLPFFNTKLPSLRLPGFSNPQPGDLVIFESPVDPSRDFIKRCIAIGGQIVEIKDKAVYVNGEKFKNYPGVKHEDHRVFGKKRTPRDNYGPQTVPTNHIFVMGDNRDRSHDSRFWGMVPLENVKAHPLLIYYSLDSHNQISVWNIFKKIRWDRLGFLD